MGKKNRNRNRAYHNQHAGQKFGHGGGGHIQHVRSAPLLQKRQVPLRSCFEFSGNSTDFTTMVLGLNGNGLIAQNSTSIRIPQEDIWNTYAQMYEYYQVDSLQMTWMPNKFEYLKSTETGQTNGDSVVYKPSFMGLAPNDILPVTTQEILAYNTSEPRVSYAQNRMTVGNYKALSIQKQPKTILATNGSAANREKYIDPATIALLAFNPRESGTLSSADPQFGFVFFTINYTFSGLIIPGSTSPVRPMPVPMVIAPYQEGNDVQNSQAIANQVLRVLANSDVLSVSTAASSVKK